METILVSAGVVCLIAAVVGGGLKALNMDIPLVDSLVRQLILFGVGVILIGMTYMLDPNQSSERTSSVGDPSTSSVGNPTTLSVGNPSTSSVGNPTTSSVGNPSTSSVADQCARVVADPNPPLNVRAAPDAGAPVVGSLENGTELRVLENRQGWFRIASPMSGWVFAQNTVCSP